MLACMDVGERTWDYEIIPGGQTGTHVGRGSLRTAVQSVQDCTSEDETRPLCDGGPTCYDCAPYTLEDTEDDAPESLAPVSEEDAHGWRLPCIMVEKDHEVKPSKAYDIGARRAQGLRQASA